MKCLHFATNWNLNLSEKGVDQSKKKVGRQYYKLF